MNIADWMGLLGGSAGLLSLAVSWAQYARDKACLKIEIADDGLDTAFIAIVNIGRRPIKITGVGFVTSGYSALYFFEKTFRPKMLKEGENISALGRFPPGSAEVFAGFAMGLRGLRQRFMVCYRSRK